MTSALVDERQRRRDACRRNDRGLASSWRASRKDIALEEVDSLKKKGHDPFLIQKGKYVALCVGRFATKEEATILSKNLKSRYNDCFIRKL